MITSRRSASRPTARRALRALVLGALALAVSVSSSVELATAATELTPVKPTGVTVAATTGTSFTVTTAASANAKQYRVFTSTTKGNLALTTIASQTSAVAATPRVTVGGLAYTNAPYYYRVQAINTTKVSYSDVFEAYLRPDAPTNLRAVGSRSTGLSLEWDGRAAGRYVVTQATSSTLTTGVRTYSITSQARTFTPYDLTMGTRYWFQVRAYGGAFATAPTDVVSAVAPSRGQDVRVMTYNVLHSSRDGQQVALETIAPWADRRTPAVSLIQQADPDVIGLQEASDWVGASLGPKLVDDLAARLDGQYTIAKTDIPVGDRGWFRTARYILYRTSTYRAVGDGGFWTLAPNRWAAYQLLENRTTGARFLAVSVHLEAGSGLTVDLRREVQTKALLGFVKDYQATQDVPVVYVGDFNSHERNVVDAPGNTFRAAGHTDADEVAQTRVNREYNSSNGYRRLPSKGGLDLDHVYVPQGVAVRSWQIVLDLTDGQFVGAIPSDHNPVVADVVLPY